MEKRIGRLVALKYNETGDFRIGPKVYKRLGRIGKWTIGWQYIW